MGVESFFSDADEVDILPSGLFTPEKPSDASCSLRAGQQRPAKDKSAKRFAFKHPVSAIGLKSQEPAAVSQESICCTVRNASVFRRARSEGQDEGAILPAKKKSAKGKRSPQQVILAELSGHFCITSLQLALQPNAVQGKMGVESFLSDADEIDILPSGLLSHETPTYQSCNPNTGQPPPKNFGQPSKG